VPQDYEFGRPASTIGGHERTPNPQGTVAFRVGVAVPVGHRVEHVDLAGPLVLACRADELARFGIDPVCAATTG
jgi:hypothetical protein